MCFFVFFPEQKLKAEAEKHRTKRRKKRKTQKRKKINQKSRKTGDIRFCAQCKIERENTSSGNKKSIF